MRPNATVYRIHDKSQQKDKKLQSCKFCGRAHVWGKSNCPAYNKVCSACNKPNHFSKMCSTLKNNSSQPEKTKKKRDVHNIREEEKEDSSDEEWINKISIGPEQKQVKCKMIVENELVTFQVDTGSCVNIIPRKYVNENEIQNTNTILKTWNKSDYSPIGECRQTIYNPKNKKKYNVNFVVCHNNFTPIIGLTASEKMQLIEIKNNNFERTHAIEKNTTGKEDNIDQEIGRFEGVYSFKLKEGYKPTIMPSRRTPIAIRDKEKEELDRLTKLKVITPIQEPTEWVSQTVVVKKPSGKIRICLDPQELNKALIRERYVLPTLDDTLHELTQSSVFSKFDLAHGYWHVELDETSSKMTTFQTSYGRYRWLRLPFGVTVAAEVFQRKLIEALSDLNGVLCVADDIIVHGKNDEEHDKNLKKFLQRCEDKGIKLNQDKSEIKVNHMTFMGHKISEKGLEVDPEKIKAIEEFPAPKNVSELRTFLGMVNFISKFIPKLSNVLHPIHNLLKKDVEWTWTDSQRGAFKKIKFLISEHNKLAIYDPKLDINLENDASEYGLGSVLLQNGKPIAYASRTLSSSERNYAQIEKEMLAVVFGLNKFHNYVYGRNITITTDHKPLTFIVKKPLSKAPKRIQSLLLKIQDYSFDLQYKQGTKIPIADALSRGPLEEISTVHMMSNLEETPLNKNSLLMFKDATEKDPTLSTLKNTISKGWPEEKNNVPSEIRPYFYHREEMSIENGIILRGERIIVPNSLRHEMKKKIHTGHMGINSCLRRARTHLYWPGMSNDIRIFVENCPTCSADHQRQPTQPLYAHKIPRRPWQKLGIDIFTIKSRNYLVTVDYYSQFFEVDFLPSMTSSTIIHKMKAHFARYGLPEVIFSDNGRQMTSKEFQDFCTEYDIKHETSSPGNSKANGMAEAAVKTAKKLMLRSLKNHEDPYLALLCHRNTPQEDLEVTPAQRLMGRRTRTLIPTTQSLLQPATVDSDKFIRKKEGKQAKMCSKYASRPVLPHLTSNDIVRMQPIDGSKEWKQAKVVSPVKNNPRSYIVEDAQGQQYRRDRQYLRHKPNHLTQSSDIHASPPSPASDDQPTPSQPPSPTPQTESDVSQGNKTNETFITRAGRVCKKPIRYPK